MMSVCKFPLIAATDLTVVRHISVMYLGQGRSSVLAVTLALIQAGCNTHSLISFTGAIAFSRSACVS